MTLTKEQFDAAMRIIARHHTTMLKINMPVNNFVGNLGSNEFSIHISRCCAGLTQDLHDQGFDIEMDNHGMSVFKL